MSVIIIGSALLILWVIICIVAVRFDIGEDSVGHIVSLLGSFVYLTLALPTFFETALCYPCWSDKATGQLNLLVVGALAVSVIFILDILRAVRAARQRAAK